MTYQGDLLWSINERLGELLRRLGAKVVPGLALERLGDSWMEDVVDVAEEEGRAIERAEEKANRDAHRY